MDTTFDVRVYKTEVYRGTHVCSHRVRWKAGRHEWRRTFRSAAQADVFRGELLAAARKGEAFSLATGEPVSWRRAQPGSGWYEFVCAYVDMKMGRRLGQVPAGNRASPRVCDRGHGGRHQRHA